jgi:HSP20 family molecular chaperone IbpA
MRSHKRSSENPLPLLNPLSSILAADLIEREHDYQVHVDLPGVRPEDVEVMVSSGRVHIKAQRQQVHESSGSTGGYSHRIERSFGRVERSLAIPKNAVTDSAESHFDNGVLTVTFAKREVEAPRKLEIKTSPVPPRPPAAAPAAASSSGAAK